MARTDKAIVKRFAVYVKELKNGRPVFVRRPYHLVEYNWGDITANRTYIQPIYGGAWSRSAKEVFDDVRIFDSPPDWDLLRGGSDL